MMTIYIYRERERERERKRERERERDLKRMYIYTKMPDSRVFHGVP